MKPFGIIKTILYLIGGIAVLALNETIMGHHYYVGIVVGIVILSYAIDVMIIGVISRNILTRVGIYTVTTHVLLAVVLFLVRDTLVTVCLVWAVWTILREGNEISEGIHRIMNKKSGFINILESVIIIMFSFAMILEPTEHHAHVHIIILGIELILEALFPFINNWLDTFNDKIRLAVALENDKNGAAAPGQTIADGEIAVADTLEEEKEALYSDAIGTDPEKEVSVVETVGVEDEKTK